MNFLVKLGLDSALLGAALLASALPASAEPLAVSNLDAQLISYFRPYSPSAEVLVNKVEKNLPAAAKAGDKVDGKQKTAGNSKSINNSQICSETAASQTEELEGLDNKQPKTPKLP